MRIVLALVIVVGATAVVVNLSRVAKRMPLPVSNLDYINS